MGFRVGATRITFFTLGESQKETAKGVEVFVCSLSRNGRDTTTS